MDFSIMRARSALYSNIRHFFDSRGYLEAETPVLSPDLIPEATIDNFETDFFNEFCGGMKMYMVPSPEIFIKKLIAQGSGSIYEISKCFRNSEQIGRIHNPEFTMLEYYTVDADENDSIAITAQMIQETALEGCKACVLAPFEVMTVRSAVLRYSGLDLDALQDPRELRKAASGLMGIAIPDDESWDDTFNRLFINYVETGIPKDHPVVLTDYPRQIECLAQRQGNYRRRWEMYINGIEVANCYLEERDVANVKDYYRTEYAKLVASRSDNGRVIPDCDGSFADIFATFPKCSGVAMGLDRLLMAELGCDDILQVLPFAVAKNL